MEQRPNVAVLSGFGINCETETMAVFEMAGATSERVHINKLVMANSPYLTMTSWLSQGGSPLGITWVVAD